MKDRLSFIVHPSSIFLCGLAPLRETFFAVKGSTVQRFVHVVIALCAVLPLALSGCGERRSADIRPVPLLGQAAPAFETVDPDGQPIDLKQHLGKSVIMLDFWATSCGPCLLAMPEVEQVAKEFADRGLVFYAVNVGEDPDTVKEFLKNSGVDVPVAMDPLLKIHDAYQTQYLPQTILVGKDGRVQVIHLGYSDFLADELTESIEALLAGRDLASEALGE
jgi:thiol-disulfide isomerase/thioredoxin